MPARIVDQVVGYFGNAHRTADAIGVAPITIRRWREVGFIPARYASSVERATDFTITADEVIHAAKDYVNAQGVVTALRDRRVT